MNSTLKVVAIWLEEYLEQLAREMDEEGVLPALRWHIAFVFALFLVKFGWIWFHQSVQPVVQIPVVPFHCEIGWDFLCFYPRNFDVTSLTRGVMFFVGLVLLMGLTGHFVALLNKPLALLLPEWLEKASDWVNN